MGFIRGLVATLGGITVMLGSLAIGMFYLVAFLEGADTWFGWSGFWVGILGVALVMFTGPIGMLVLGVVGGYGALYGWHWNWIACVIVFFPGIPIVVGVALMSAAASVFDRSRA